MAPWATLVPTGRGAAAVTIGLLASMAAAVFMYRNVSARRRRLVGRVSRLFVYPLKSARGVEVSEARCLPTGMKFQQLTDRHWVITTEDGASITARKEPRLLLVSCSNPSNGILCLSAPGMADLKVPIQLPNKCSTHHFRLFQMDMEGRDCGKEASIWLTSFLQSAIPYRLVQYDESLATRPMRKMKVPGISQIPCTKDDKVEFPDFGPYMLITEASLEDLNSRLEKQVSIHNFRPNILVRGCTPTPYAEDFWKTLEVGNVKLRFLTHCTRCIFTTIDPETGVKDGHEPLDTLNSYRQYEPSLRKVFGSAPCFGVYLAIINPGIIQVGDPVYSIG
uniref:mitochondrial amidoxime-reducing component 1 n=1 Tax=Myxine glutinosa TaxID=7769 RepID=UPI00358E2CF6